MPYSYSDLTWLAEFEIRDITNLNEKWRLVHLISKWSEVFSGETLFAILIRQARMVLAKLVKPFTLFMNIRKHR